MHKIAFIRYSRVQKRLNPSACKNDCSNACKNEQPPHQKGSAAPSPSNNLPPWFFAKTNKVGCHDLASGQRSSLETFSMSTLSFPSTRTQKHRFSLGKRNAS